MKKTPNVVHVSKLKPYVPDEFKANIDIIVDREGNVEQ